MGGPLAGPYEGVGGQMVYVIAPYAGFWKVCAERLPGQGQGTHQPETGRTTDCGPREERAHV